MQTEEKIVKIRCGLPGSPLEDVLLTGDGIGYTFTHPDLPECAKFYQGNETIIVPLRSLAYVRMNLSK